MIKLILKKLNIIRAYDYCSPNLVKLPGSFNNHFPNIVYHEPNNFFIPHLARSDNRFPVGVATWDELHILYNTSLMLKGKPFLEIGCWVGWSTTALAMGGVYLTVVDPVLGGGLPGESCRASLRNAGVLDKVALIPGYSPAAVKTLGREGKRFSGFLIDGDHSDDAPIQDAQACMEVADDSCVMLFHDTIQENVATCLKWLKGQGWQCAIYYTSQFIGAAWQGGIFPVSHQPDPKINWKRLISTKYPHLRCFNTILV